MMEAFLTFSSEVTAFTVFELRGTGQAEAYLRSVQEVVGSDTVRELLDRYMALGSASAPDRKERLRRGIFGDEKLGPIARNIIKLWYVGIWYQLPRDWAQAYGARDKDVTFMVSAAAYTEGLLWPAVGAHPPGAKAPGYGSWAQPPHIPGLTDKPALPRRSDSIPPAGEPSDGSQGARRRRSERPVSLPIIEASRAQD